MALAGLLGAGLLMFLFLDWSKGDLMNEKKTEMRNLVDVAYSTIDYYYKFYAGGKMSEEQAKAAAVTALKALRYGGSNYFWINDMRVPYPVMIMHPTVSELDGRVLDDPRFNCATSQQEGLDGPIISTDGKKNLFQSVVEVAAGNKGEGYVTYNWPKPLNDGGVTAELFPKMSFVKAYKNWNWIIGSGSYIDDVDKTFWHHARSFSIDAGLIALLMIGLWAPIVVSIIKTSKALRRVEETMNAMSGGNLGIKFYADDNDAAAGEIEAAINKTIKYFADIVNQIVISISGVINATDSIRNNADTAHEKTGLQAEQANAVATAAAEMTSTIASISNNTSTAANTSLEARKIAQSCQAIAETAVKTIAHVQDSTMELSGLVERLNGRTGEIGEIVTVIKDIADQTNLLALNAAIEAARAGEQGRGFAVVADEVRKLAERTIMATAEISGKIGAVQKDSRLTSDSMDIASKSVAEATSLIKDLGAPLQEIVRSTQEANDQIMQIAGAVEQQSATSEEIARNISAASDISREVDSSSRTIITEINGLLSIIVNLRATALKFSTGDTTVMLTTLKDGHRIMYGKVRNCVMNGERTDPSIIPAVEVCKVCAWIHSTGEKYRNSSSFGKMKELHLRYHDVATDAIREGNAGNKQKAVGLLKEQEATLNEICNLLDKIGAGV
jgi:methyl-accepting chemotaxis protein